MRTGHEITIKQTLKTALGAELKQAITVLQLSSQELINYVEQQLVENPLLELKEEEGDSETPLNEIKEAESVEDYGSDWVDYFCDSSDLGFVPKPETDSPPVLPEPPGRLPTLYEHLTSQLGFLRLGKEERLIGEYLIGNIGVDGYLKATTEEVAFSLGVPEETVEKVLKLIQTMDPPGVGARSLKECLSIQAERSGMDYIVKAVISDHLEELAAGKVAKIASRIGVSTDQVAKAVKAVRSLNPKPGSVFAGEPVQYIVPDLIIQKTGGEYVVLINDNAYPRLRTNPTYRELLRRGGLNRETKVFIQSKLKQALWLIKSIEKRQTTLHRIANVLVDMQRGFLDAGVSALKPLTLKEVAEAVGLHQSTVSRAIANKYVQCPRGIFQLKFFFNSAVTERGGSTIAAQSVKHWIKEIVAAENPERPLSDQEIARALYLRGARISRRTVAKYRADLSIPGAAKRRNSRRMSK
ncbi:MAG: RNA polymerase factor sigma-54 [Bacillota bacterium]